MRLCRNSSDVFRVQSLLDTGVQKELAGDVKGALKDFSKAIKRSRKSSEAYYRRGNLYSKLGKQKKALSDLNKAINLDPNDAGALVSRALVWKALKKKDNALKDFARAIEIEKKPQSLARIYQYRGDFRRTDTDYSSSIDLKGEVWKSLSKEMGKRMDIAIKDYTMAIELVPDNPEYYLLRADAKSNNNDFSGALNDFEQALQIVPCYSKGLIARAKFHSRKDLKKSLDDYNKAIECDPSYQTGYVLRALIKIRLDDIDSALIDLTRAIEMNPKDSFSFLTRGEIYLKKKRYAEAVTDFTTTIGFHPNGDKAYAARGIAYLYLGKARLAKSDLEKAVKLNPASRNRLQKEIEKYNAEVQQN